MFLTLFSLFSLSTSILVRSNGATLTTQPIRYATAGRFTLPTLLTYPPPPPTNSHRHTLTQTTQQLNVPACPQLAHSTPFIPRLPFGPFSNQSEDCLFLSLTFPTDHTPTSTPLPVLVFMIGGGFIAGAISQPLYQGPLLSQPYLRVTVQYRLGPLGFAAVGGVANAGLHDQLAALRWVSNHIASFGGDPTQVTLAGESAGGISVCLALLSPPFRPLFHRAIVESGPCANINLVASSVAAEARALELGLAVGCPTADLSCMQAVSLSTMMNALPLLNGSQPAGTIWAPTIDGTLVTAPPRPAYWSGSSLLPSDVPILAGYNRKAGSIWVDWDMSTLDYTADLLAAFGPLSGEVGTAYDELVYPKPEPGQAWSAVLTDGFFGCPDATAATGLATAGATVYSYLFAYEPSWASDQPLLGAYHSAELPFVLATLPSPGTTLSDDDRAMMKLMSTVWSQFITTGAIDVVPWPTYSASKRERLVIASATNTSVVNNYRGDHCDFWDGLIDQTCLTVPCRCNGDCV